MKFRSIGAVLAAAAFVLTGSSLFYVRGAQEGPQSQSSDSVAKPRKKPPSDDNINAPAPPPPPEEAPIPSEYKKPKDVPAETPTFRSNATTVNVDVAVLDDKNHFIPRIPRSNFRVLEDGVPQEISQFGQG